MIQHETLDSATSYGVGGMAIIISHLSDVASVAQALGIIFGCAVVFIRLVHDVVRLRRFWDDK